MIDYSEVPVEQIQNYSEIDFYPLKMGNKEIKTIIFVMILR